MSNHCQRRLITSQLRAARLHEQCYAANLADWKRAQLLIIFFQLAIESEKLDLPNKEEA